LAEPENTTMQLMRETEMETRVPLKDHGGRRSGIERRQFSYSIHIPERRSGKDRRVLPDRRRKIRYQQEGQKAGRLEGWKAGRFEG